MIKYTTPKENRSHFFKSCGICQISGAVYPSLPEIVAFGIGVYPFIFANPKSHIFTK